MKNLSIPSTSATLRLLVSAGTTIFVVASLLMASLLSSCQEVETAPTAEHEMPSSALSAASTPAAFPHSGNLVEVTSRHMDFVLPDEIPSGWTTFRYHNQSHMVHFFVLEKMPIADGEQKTLADTKAEVFPVFQQAMDLINAGQAEAGFAAFGNLPAWFFQVVFNGGVGLVSAGETAQTTLLLEPGVYVIECYVKTGGKFHGLFGMAKQLVVTEATTAASPPKVSLQMELSREGGLAIDGKLRPGLHTIAVSFEDQGPHEHFLGHDVHLVRLTEDTDMPALEGWMDWSSPTGMETPAPDGVTFLGGAQEMPAGNVAYITAHLKPGRYAFISEVPNPSAKGMLHSFRIPEGKRASR